MRAFLVLCIIIGVRNTQEYNYNAPQISQPQQLYNAPPIASESVNKLNQGYNYEAPAQLYESPQSFPAQPDYGYNYNPPEEPRYAPTLEKVPLAHPTAELPTYGYNYESPAPSQLYSSPTVSSEPEQEPNPKYLPPEPQTTVPPTVPSPAEKYLPAQQTTSSAQESFYPVPNPTQEDLPKSYNYKPNQPSSVVVSKHFFIPQSKNNKSQGYHYGPPARTHYKVIFIRTPTPERTVSEQQPQIKEEKTVIYVLNQADSGQKYLPPPNPAPTTVQTKPEVFFLNYRTPEEAAQAQQEIQAQYDALGGGAAHIEDESGNGYRPPSPGLYPETF